MVEKITEDALLNYTENLAAKGVLTSELKAEIDQLTRGMTGFSNWTEAGQTLREMGSKRLVGHGPMSKFLRTLAYALEKLEGGSDQLLANQIVVDGVTLSDTTSGCSDYRGYVVVHGRKGDGRVVEIFEGGFVWDCAGQGMSQADAAQQLGYRCMAAFPSFEVEPASRG